MEIGVKYCGGCNSKYDRTEFLEKIKLKCSEDIIFKHIDEKTEVDLIIVICGCNIACADYKSIKSKNGSVLISNENDINSIIHKINELQTSLAL